MNKLLSVLGIIILGIVNIYSGCCGNGCCGGNKNDNSSNKTKTQGGKRGLGFKRGGPEIDIKGPKKGDKNNKGKGGEVKLIISEDTIKFVGDNFNREHNKVEIDPELTNNKLFNCSYFNISDYEYNLITFKMVHVSGRNEIELSKEKPYLIVAVLDTDDNYYIIYCENANNVNNMGLFAGIKKIKGVRIIYNGKLTNCASMFYECSSLEKLDLSNLNTQNVTDMSFMFYGCSSLKNLNLSNFNTQNVTNMYSMFRSCKSLTNINLSNFNTKNVTDMSNMFNECNSLTNIDLSNFNTQNVTNMKYMFFRCSSLPDINLSNFNTQKVTAMSGMFYGCSSLVGLDLSKFNTGSVKSFVDMFGNCDNLTQLILSNNFKASSANKDNNSTHLFGGEGKPENLKIYINEKPVENLDGFNIKKYWV